MENNELINKLDELLAKYNAAKKKLEERRNLHKPTPPAVIWSQLDLDGWSEELKEYENIDHQLGQQAVEAKIEMRQALDCMDNLMKVRGAWYRVTGGYIRLSFSSRSVGELRLTYKRIRMVASLVLTLARKCKEWSNDGNLY